MTQQPSHQTITSTPKNSESVSLPYYTSVLSRHSFVKVMKQMMASHPELAAEFQNELLKEKVRLNVSKNNLDTISFSAVRKKLLEHKKNLLKIQHENLPSIPNQEKMKQLATQITTDVQRIFDAIFALCVDENTCIGEYERSCSVLHEVWLMCDQIQLLDKTRILLQDKFKIKDRLMGLDAATLNTYREIFHCAATDPSVHEKTLEGLMEESLDIPDPLYWDIQQRLPDNGLCRILMTTVVKNTFLKQPSWQKYSFLARKVHIAISPEEIQTLIDGLVAADQKWLAARCMVHRAELFFQLSGVLKFISEILEENPKLVIPVDGVWALYELLNKVLASGKITLNTRRPAVETIVEIFSTQWIRHTKKGYKRIMKEFQRQFPGVEYPTSINDVCAFQIQLGDKVEHIRPYTMAHSTFNSVYSLLHSGCKSRGWHDLDEKKDATKLKVYEIIDQRPLNLIYGTLERHWKENTDELAHLCCVYNSELGNVKAFKRKAQNKALIEKKQKVSAVQ